MSTGDRLAIHYSLSVLAENEWNNLDVSRLLGTKSDNAYRLRVGKYRVLFELFEDQCIIHVIKIGPRGDVYK